MALILTVYFVGIVRRRWLLHGPTDVVRNGMEWNEICLVFDSTFELKTDVEKKIHAVFQSMVSVHLVIRQMLHHQQKHKHKILIQSGEQLEIHKKTKTARGECEIWIRLLREHFCGVYGVLHKEAMVR